MKIKLAFTTLFFLVSFYSLAQNYDIENIRAAVISPHNGDAYFFVGKDKVYQYEPATQKKVAIRNLGSDAFKGIPIDIDAALVHPTTKKVFVFRGNNWYRYNMRDGKRERTGVIGSDGFKGITGPFDAALAHGTSGNYAFFKGGRVYIYNPKTEKVQYSDKIGANNVYQGVPSNIDAAVQWNNGKVYFFKGDYYWRYDPKKLRVDAQKRVTGRDGFKKLFPGFDAALPNAGFKDDYYWELIPAKQKVLGITYHEPSWSASKVLSDISKDVYLDGLFKKKKTSFGREHYEGIPNPLDAAFRSGHSKKKVFLKEGIWYRYNGTERKVERTGEITKTWKGVPKDIDAAISIEKKGYHYFFKDNQFWRWDYKTRRVDKSGDIRSEFKGVPDYLDAALTLKHDSNLIYFYKKTTEYTYDTRSRRVIRKKSIARITK